MAILQIVAEPIWRQEKMLNTASQFVASSLLPYSYSVEGALCLCFPRYVDHIQALLSEPGIAVFATFPPFRAFSAKFDLAAVCLRILCRTTNKGCRSLPVLSYYTANPRQRRRFVPNPFFGTMAAPAIFTVECRRGHLALNVLCNLLTQGGVSYQLNHSKR